ncbi:hypothetical protein AB0M46_48955 [Dactylosporangium sp. NPDC051485]|uniref:hypothetical protein n=1 Tax=Dactylosporangium sp. NPDC051485 TaxID=3154846 RepID=UPI003426604C
MSEDSPHSQGPRPPVWNRRPALPPAAAPSPRPAPPPAATATRIPDNVPFLVRPSVLRRALVFVPLVVALLFVIGCPAALTLTADGPEHTSGDIVLLVAGMSCLVVTFGTALALHLIAHTAGGPILGVSPAGVWVRRVGLRRSVTWLPWEQVAEIHRGRRLLEKVVSVRPRTGERHTATLTFADRSEDEILAALREFSGGRAQLRF